MRRERRETVYDKTVKQLMKGKLVFDDPSDFFISVIIPTEIFIK